MSQAYRSAKLDREFIEVLPALRRFAARFCRTSHDAEDLVQETLVKGLANIDKFQEGTRLKSWLFTILRNTFNTRYSVAKREQVGISDNLMSPATVQPHQEWALRGQELEAAISDLPACYRTPLQLVMIQGMSYDDAAKRCSCPVGTIKSRVNRARERLTAALDA